MNIKNVTALIVGLGLMATLTACEEQSDKDKVMEAQYCLDKASTGAAAQACVAGIAAMQTPQASALKCAAGFISAGVTTSSNLATALNSISNGGGATNLLSALNFGDVSDANNTATYCTDSLQPGLALIGAMAKSATALANAGATFSSCAGGITSCSASEMQSAITDIATSIAAGAGDPHYADAIATVTAVASSVQTVYASTCSGSATTNDDICGQINNALDAAGVTDIANADLVALGQQLLNQWQH